MSDVQVWMDAAAFLSARIQGPEDWSENEVQEQNRESDMSNVAKMALRTMLGQMEAILKLMSNREKVAQDITNSGPTGLKGGKLTQLNLKRLEPNNKAYVDKMLVAVCDRLLGKRISAPSTPDEALVWAKAARFLSNRIQGEPYACPGRTPDMSAAQASAMRKVLGQIEAASKLMSNLETVVKDITNTGPRGVYGRALSQTELKRVDPKYAASVKQMACEVYGRLYGTVASEPPATSDMQVWMDAAAFLSARIQGPEDWSDNEVQEQNRESDMSNVAKMALRTMLGQMEAILKLMSNREKVVKDITNPGPSGVNGGNLTQLDLKRVDQKQQTSVDAMVKEMCSRLLGNKSCAPSTEQKQVWEEAAMFLNGRIQGSAYACPGRTPDMSAAAAKAMRTVLTQISS